MRAYPWYGTIFLFLEQIAPSWRHISALIHVRVVGSRVYVVTLHDQVRVESCEIPCSMRIFHIRPGRRHRALLWCELMDKLSFSFEWIISARAGCCKLVNYCVCYATLHSYIELISEFPKEWVIMTKILFCRVSYCFCLFGEFAKGFERQVRVAQLPSAARALSSPCFNKSWQRFVCVVFCAEMLEQFLPTSKGY